LNCGGSAATLMRLPCSLAGVLAGRTAFSHLPIEIPSSHSIRTPMPRANKGGWKTCSRDRTHHIPAVKVPVTLLLAILACDETPDKAAPDSVRVASSVSGKGSDSMPRTDSGTVLVQGPTLVAFYPTATQAQVDSSEELATVFDDFSHHLSTAADSLRALGITITVRPAGLIQLLEGSRRREFIPASDSADVGYLFLAPGRAHRVHYGVMTNSELVDRAREYLTSTP
jgi:hypothetical protein